MRIRIFIVDPEGKATISFIKGPRPKNNICCNCRKPTDNKFYCSRACGREYRKKYE